MTCLIWYYFSGVFLGCFGKHTSCRFLVPDLILRGNTPDLISQTMNNDTQFWWDVVKLFNWDSTLSLFPWCGCQTHLSVEFKLSFVLSPLHQELALTDRHSVIKSNIAQYPCLLTSLLWLYLSPSYLSFG